MNITKKSHKIHLKSSSHTRHILRFGTYGFKIMSTIVLTTEQIQSLNRFLLKTIKNQSAFSKTCKLWSLVKTNKALTKLSLESRMGKGKGSIYTEAVLLKSGSIIYEFKNYKKHQIIDLFNLFRKQIPCTELKLVYRK
uniref:Ribosomal protein L16 n=1 Tax=Corallina chilensis TaxID=2582857 RepID=A0A4V1FUN0_9FLOR|nr:ribosomal protein L16 [Corallina chilensis]QCS25441.1 ribosomal protein L16 [Corallina chilensis]